MPKAKFPKWSTNVLISVIGKPFNWCSMWFASYNLPRTEHRLYALDEQVFIDPKDRYFTRIPVSVMAAVDTDGRGVIASCRHAVDDLDGAEFGTHRVTLWSYPLQSKIRELELQRDKQLEHVAIAGLQAIFVRDQDGQLPIWTRAMTSLAKRCNFSRPLPFSTKSRRGRASCRAWQID